MAAMLYLRSGNTELSSSRSMVSDAGSSKRATGSSFECMTDGVLSVLMGGERRVGEDWTDNLAI